MSEDDIPARSRNQQNSSGFNDFCVKDIRLKSFGRREIDFAEQGNNKKFILFSVLYFLYLLAIKIYWNFCEQYF